MARSLCGFLGAYTGWTFNLIFTWLLFFVIAVPEVTKYGYSNTEASTDGEGGIMSGPAGSGVFPVVLVLFLVCTLVYFTFMIKYFTSKEDEEEKKD